MIVDTEKELREADGSVRIYEAALALASAQCQNAQGRMERLSLSGAPQTDGRAGEEPEDHKRYEIRILAPEMEIMKETPWSRIQGQNSVYKEFLEIVGNGSPRAVL